MVKIADIGNFETVPPFVAALLAGDVAALDSALAEGCDIETAIVLGPHTKEPLLMLALAAHATASVHWLVERGADLNRADAPAFPLAARYGTPDLMRYLAAHGADIHARRKVGGDAYQQALYGKKLKHLPVIEALGTPWPCMAGKPSARRYSIATGRRWISFSRMAWTSISAPATRCSPIARRPCWWPPAIAT